MFSCEPLLLYKNYNKSVENMQYANHNVNLFKCIPHFGKELYFLKLFLKPNSFINVQCVLPCDRWEYTVAVDKTDFRTIFNNRTDDELKYRIDVSYNDLQYELIEEVSTITFAGLISQIGGQVRCIYLKKLIRKFS